MICGIYKIENIKNNKSYIGKSTNIFRRWIEHQHKLINGSHHSSKLQLDWNDYGATSFSFSILVTCNKSELDGHEEKYIHLYNSLNEGYNVQSVGEINANSIDNRVVKSEKYIVDLAKLEKYSLYEIANILHIFMNSTGTGRINNFKKVKDLNELLINSNEKFNKTLCAKLRKDNLMQYDDKKFLIVNNDVCRKVYQYNAKVNKNEFYVYKDCIEMLYNNKHITYAKIVKLINNINYNINCICKKEDILLEEYCCDSISKLLTNKKITKEGSKRLIESINGDFELIKKHNGCIYVNPLLLHKPQALKDINNLLDIFNYKITN